jgi:peptidyl-prolyl cis-trans isomerase D
MFDFVQKHKTVASLSLGLVGLGFLVGGGFAAQGLSGGGGDSYLAKVDGYKITDRDLAQASGGQPIPDAMKPQAIQQLVERRVLLNEATKRYITTSDTMLRDAIMNIDDFKKDGHFDVERYKTLLAAQQMTVDQFEARMRERRSLQLLGGPIAESGFASKLAVDRLVDALATPRDVASVTFAAAQYMDKVSASAAEIKQYYDTHHAEFNQPERVKLDYVVLSRDEMAASLPVDDKDVRSYYDAHKAELAPEQRRVRHILIKADAKAPPAERAAAKQKAEQLLAELKKNPSKFADLAKQDSQDPGSAANGGDLGYFGHGAMVKAFDDAAFKLAKDEISNVVETEYGYHILQLVDIKTKSLDELKPMIVAKLQHEQVMQRFQAEVDKVSDMAYQQPDSLKPLVDAFKLQARTSDWVTRDAASDPILNDTKLREAVFSPDVLTKKHNSEALEIKPGLVVVARVAQHQDATLLPLDVVTPEIEARLKHDRAVAMAVAEGKKALAALQSGQPIAPPFSPAKQASRLNGQGLPPAALTAVFDLPANKLPGYVGVDAADSYVVYKVSAGAAKDDAAIKASVVPQIAQQMGEQGVEAYINLLKTQHKVEVPQK